MSDRPICEVCKKQPAMEEHHKFSQGSPRGWRRKAYGKLLDHPFNKVKVCRECHTNERSMKWSEIKFCLELGIIPRSKQGLEEWKKHGYRLTTKDLEEAQKYIDNKPKRRQNKTQII